MISKYLKFQPQTRFDIETRFFSLSLSLKMLVQLHCLQGSEHNIAYKADTIIHFNSLYKCYFNASMAVSFFLVNLLPCDIVQD